MKTLLGCLVAVQVALMSVAAHAAESCAWPDMMFSVSTDGDNQERGYQTLEVTSGKFLDDGRLLQGTARFTDYRRNQAPAILEAKLQCFQEFNSCVLHMPQSNRETIAIMLQVVAEPGRETIAVMPGVEAMVRKLDYNFDWHKYGPDTDDRTANPEIYNVFKSIGCNPQASVAKKMDRVREEVVRSSDHKRENASNAGPKPELVSKSYKQCDWNRRVFRSLKKRRMPHRYQTLRFAGGATGGEAVFTEYRFGAAAWESRPKYQCSNGDAICSFGFEMESGKSTRFEYEQFSLADGGSFIVTPTMRQSLYRKQYKSLKPDPFKKLWMNGNRPEGMKYALPQNVYRYWKCREPRGE